jgi:hypothetical protein
MDVETDHWDRRSKPMPSAPVELPFQRSFTEAEVQWLRRGLLPQRMEDKWFGILRSNSLDFYRSWTGYHVYRLSTREERSGIEIGPLIVNDDPEQYRRRDDGFDFERVDRLIGWMLTAESTT